MPPVSEKQRKLFRWAAANPAAARARGIKPAVAKDFNAADPGGKLPKVAKPAKKPSLAMAELGRRR